MTLEISAARDTTEYKAIFLKDAATIAEVAEWLRTTGHDRSASASAGSLYTHAENADDLEPIVGEWLLIGPFGQRVMSESQYRYTCTVPPPATSPKPTTRGNRHTPACGCEPQTAEGGHVPPGEYPP